MRATDGNPSPSLFSVDTRDGAGVAERAERRRFRIVCDYSVLAGCWCRDDVSSRITLRYILCVCVCLRLQNMMGKTQTLLFSSLALEDDGTILLGFVDDESKSIIREYVRFSSPRGTYG